MTDRLHIGNRYLSHVGLNWHDNTARMHDPLLMRFTSPDPLASKYPDLSPWAHTAANPVNAIDPSGLYVIADQWFQDGIRDGLSTIENNYVEFDMNGNLNNELLNQCQSNSACFLALKELANSELLFISKGASTCIVNGIEKEFKSSYKEGLIGQVLAPGCYFAPSPDENVYVYTSNKLSSINRALNIAHEMYSHAFLFLKSLTNPNINPWHDKGAMVTNIIYPEDGSEPEVIINWSAERNSNLDYQIKSTQKDALKNYVNKILNSPAKLW